MEYLCQGFLLHWSINCLFLRGYANHPTKYHPKLALTSDTSSFKYLYSVGRLMLNMERSLGIGVLLSLWSSLSKATSSGLRRAGLPPALGMGRQVQGRLAGGNPPDLHRVGRSETKEVWGHPPGGNAYLVRG